MIFSILTNLVNKVGILIVLAFLISKTTPFRKLINEKDISILEIFIYACFFGGLGIIGTYTGIPVKDALANSRVIGVFVGGLLGGPVVGILAGLIAGIHRWAIDINGFTAFACAISTLAEGALAGFLSKKFYKSENKWFFSLYLGAIAEIMQMIIILIIAKPFSQAIELVELISLPMIVANSIGIAIFIGIIESIYKDQERIAALQAQIALEIADKTLKYLRRGIDEESAKKTCEIIYKMTTFKAVAITNRDKILAHIGIEEDHHRSGDKIKTYITREVLISGKYKIGSNSNEIGCDYARCKLKSVIIVPLKEQNIVIGALKLYNTTENSITRVDTELALGLAALFSTQIELSKIERQSKLLARAELKALQAQINPHFLFNAINTIVSLVRSKPDKARELLLHLSHYFRKNLQQNVEEVSLDKEIEHIKSYIEIEKARFEDNLNVYFHIDENLNCYLPPFILQPIVENAIKHGIMGKIEGVNINIYAYQMNNETILKVEDDGVGISKDYIYKLLKNEISTDSVGLTNVNNRLINKYGDTYKLKIDSELGKGTTVIMKIPNREV